MGDGQLTSAIGSKSKRATTTVVAMDVRALQDENYATKGIGQHTAYIAELLRATQNTKLLPFGDPLARPLRKEHAALFDAPLRRLLDLEGDVYLNPSPLTGDTTLLVLAMRLGMRTGAVVHDFIPLRQKALQENVEAAAAYNYLVQSLTRYHFLLPNSSFTEKEIRTVLSAYRGVVATVHCRSRFRAKGLAADPKLPIRQLMSELRAGGPYVFLGGADDPRKNVDVAIRACVDLNAMGLRLVIGGGLGESTKKQLLNEYPEQFILARPVILPRLTDEELSEAYLGAKVVLVCSLDEGFSLPVAEGIAFDRTIVASNIPAHREQILDPSLLFDPEDPRSLLEAVRYALNPNARAKAPASRYRQFDHDAEAVQLRGLISGAVAKRATTKSALTIVGPAFDKHTGIAVYNRLLVAELQSQGKDFRYVDLDGLDANAFYEWLFANQPTDIIFVMGNNDIHHSRCFTALENIPGRCIMHDSRLFEFLLNRAGPYKVAEVWNAGHRAQPIDIDTVIGWQRERRLLKHSFLEPLTSHATALYVHSKILARHIADTYDYKPVRYLPFALQMTAEEVRAVMELRRQRRRTAAQPLHMAMLGETEPTKGCCEIIFAVKILLLMGVDVELHFVGKSEEPYRSELHDNVQRLNIGDKVHFSNYVSRHIYLDHLAQADVVVQLRYSLFGQVSGPLGDAVACGVPAVATEELAKGMDLEEYCAVVPDNFSPLHIAKAIRALAGANLKRAPRWKINRMDSYVTELLGTEAITTTAPASHVI